MINLVINDDKIYHMLLCGDTFGKQMKGTTWLSDFRVVRICRCNKMIEISMDVGSTIEFKVTKSMGQGVPSRGKILRANIFFCHDNQVINRTRILKPPMCCIWELNLVATMPADEESVPIFCVQIMFSNASTKERMVHRAWFNSSSWRAKFYQKVFV